MSHLPSDHRSGGTRRNGGRRLTLGIAAAAAATTIAVFGATAVVHAQDSQPSAQPKPRVERVGLTPEPVGAGWEAQVGTDANLVAVQWNGDNTASYTFEYRNANGEWRRAARTELFDNGPDAGTKDALAGGATPETKNVSEPVWVGRNVTGVRVRLDEGTARDVTLHAIDSTRGKKPTTNVESTGTPLEPRTAPATAPASTMPPPSGPAGGGAPGGGDGTNTTTTTTTQPAQQGLGLGQGLVAAGVASVVIAFVVRRRRLVAIGVVVVIALAACAPTKGGGGGGAPMPDGIVARSAWAPDLPWNWDACPGGPEYAWVGTAIVHHTVNSNDYGPGDAVGIMRGIWAYHVQSLGYCDIAYNFLIDNYGTAYEGRLGGIDQPVIGAHSLDWNTGTTGVAILGTFSDVGPSGAAQGTLVNLIRWKFQVHGVNPFDDPAAHILGHRDTDATECPGQALYDQLPLLRESVKAGW